MPAIMITTSAVMSTIPTSGVRKWRSTTSSALPTRAISGRNPCRTVATRLERTPCISEIRHVAPPIPTSRIPTENR